MSSLLPAYGCPRSTYNFLLIGVFHFNLSPSQFEILQIICPEDHHTMERRMSMAELQLGVGPFFFFKAFATGTWYLSISRSGQDSLKNDVSSY